MTRRYRFRILIDELPSGTWRCEVFGLDPQQGNVVGSALLFGEGTTPREAHLDAIRRSAPDDLRDVLEGLLSPPPGQPREM
jgi:hypothetical protein